MLSWAVAEFCQPSRTSAFLTRGAARIARLTPDSLPHPRWRASSRIDGRPSGVAATARGDPHHRSRLGLGELPAAGLLGAMVAAAERRLRAPSGPLASARA